MEATQIDNFTNNMQWKDTDGDGYGDNQSFGPTISKTHEWKIPMGMDTVTMVTNSQTIHHSGRTLTATGMEIMARMPKDDLMGNSDDDGWGQ